MSQEQINELMKSVEPYRLRIQKDKNFSTPVPNRVVPVPAPRNIHKPNNFAASQSELSEELKDEFMKKYNDSINNMIKNEINSRLAIQMKVLENTIVARIKKELAEGKLI